MSLQDIYNKTVQEKNARERGEKDLRDKDALLCEETRKLYQTQKSEKGMYAGSLPVTLTPEMMKLVKELIALCPESEWRRPPKKPDLSTIYFFKGGGLKDKVHPERGYWPASFSYNCHGYIQCKATDGSIHLGFWEIHMSKKLEELKAPFRITMNARIRALKQAEDNQQRRERENFQQEVQSEFEKCMRGLSITGERDYILLSPCLVIKSEPTNLNIPPDCIAVFRDGTIYAPYDDSLLFNLNSFQGECARMVKGWAELS